MNQHLSDHLSDLQDAVLDNLELGLTLVERNAQNLLAPTKPLCHDPYQGITEFEVVFRLDRMRVLKYRHPDVAPVSGAIPLLLVPSMINRSYVMDLMRGASLTMHLVEQGVPTYLIDWGTPGPQHNHLTLATFTDDLIGMAIHAVRRDTGAGRVALLGYCMGGTMALIHTALHPEHVDRLTMLAAPVNFHDDSVLSQWAREERFDVDHIIDTLGRMEAPLLQSSFMLIKPLSAYQKYVGLYRSSGDAKFRESFIKLERWLNDNVAVPGEVFRSYIRTCYHENALLQRQFRLGDTPVDLDRVTCPVLNVMAAKDHIVPIASSDILGTLVPAPVTRVVVDAGHIGIAMGRKAREMFQTVAEFHLPLKARQAH